MNFNVIEKDVPLSPKGAAIETPWMTGVKMVDALEVGESVLIDPAAFPPTKRPDKGTYVSGKIGGMISTVNNKHPERQFTRRITPCKTTCRVWRLK